MSRLHRYIATYDMHVGLERAYQGGSLVTRRVENPEAIRAMFRFAEDFEPDIWLLGGDQINCGPISHWNRGTPRLVEGFSLKNEFDTFEELVLSRIESILPRRGGRKIWHRGNHEAWVSKFVEENPALDGLIAAEDYLKLLDRKWEVYGTGEVSRIGKCYNMHGDMLGTSRGIARRAVEKYRRSVRFGHVHTHETATLINPLDNDEVHTAISIPCLCARGPSYGKNAPNNWVNGFLYGYVDLATGTFYDNVALMVENRFVVNGKLYDGNKS